MHKNRMTMLIVLAVITLVVLVVTPFIGSVAVPFETLFEGPGDSQAAAVFWRLRVPRVAMAFLAGTGLAVAGMVFQAMFRNPLATPFTLGVSSGAALGAVISIQLKLSFVILGISGVSVFAFLGALGSLLLVYGITMARRKFSASTMLLAGVAVSLFFSSVILFVQYLADITSSFRMMRWMMGGVDVVDYKAVGNAFPFVASGIAITLYYTRELNLFAVGDDIAIGRGVNAVGTKRALFVATTLMVGGVVALCGPIGFVGMMAPHICRLLVGAEHRFLLPATILFGGMFLVACDTLSRILIAPAEIPVGVITALLGGPFFVWLLLRRNSDLA